MAVEMTFTIFGRVGAEPQLGGSVTESGDNAQIVEETVGAGAQDYDLNVLPFNKNYLKGLLLIASGALTVKFIGTTTTTITLAADQPYVWYASSGQANPLAADVTNAKATNNGTSSVTLKMRILTNET